MAQLYEMDSQFKEMMELLENQMFVDTETGECISEEEFNQQLDNIQMALSDKIENTMVFYKNILSDVEQFKIEVDRQFIEAENYGPYPKEDIFKYMYAEMPDDLKDQEREYERFLEWKASKVK